MAQSKVRQRRQSKPRSEVQALMDGQAAWQCSHGEGPVITALMRHTCKSQVQAAAQASRYLQVCEIGFGSGMSTVLFLAASPRTRVLTFDLFPEPLRKDEDLTSGALQVLKRWPAERLFPQQQDAIRFMTERWPFRTERIAGDSNVTVAAFAARHRDFKCDVISIDGLHTSPHVYHDIRHMRLLARPGTVLLLDDMSRPELKRDLLRAEQAGLVASDASARSCLTSCATRPLASIGFA